MSFGYHSRRCSELLPRNNSDIQRHALVSVSSHFKLERELPDTVHAPFVMCCLQRAALLQEGKISFVFALLLILECVFGIRSAEWGVMPWHWYWTSALPRSLMAGLPLAGLGACLERRARPLVAVAALYTMLYSALPHKEVHAPPFL